jgi:hypothetical protein
MAFYAKPTNRPLALEGWFEKPKNRLFGHVRVNTTFKNISVTTFVAEIGVPREIHRPVASH